MAEEWEDSWPDMVVTRGKEQCPGGKPDSRHLIRQAFDFRTRHLPISVDRNALLNRVINSLGWRYYGYYMKTKEGVEWIHIQFNN